MKKNQLDSNTITEWNTLKGINSRWLDAEECISDLQDRIVESTQVEQQKDKGI